MANELMFLLFVVGLLALGFIIGFATAIILSLE